MLIAIAFGQSTDSQGLLTTRISKLIDQLGDTNYSNRIKAQAELERIGVLALDQLHSASFHPDPQIASSARYIVQSNQFNWAWDSDPVNVRQILTNYAESHASEKSVCIDKLHRLEHDQGFGALCRLVRYETQSGLAKRAALLLMRSKPILDQTLAERKKEMLNHVTGGQSAASRWISKYAADQPVFDFPWWEHTLNEEHNLLKQGSVETNLEIVADLYRWVIEQIADKQELRQQALALGRSSLNLGKTVATLDSMIGNRTVRSNEFAQWALKCKLPELVQEQHAKLPYITASREFIFGYYLAESFAQQGNSERATQVASHTLNQVPCDDKGEVRTKSENEIRDPLRNTMDAFLDRRPFNDMERRYSLAFQLQERGLFDWAEAEYRRALGSESPKIPTVSPKNTDEDKTDEQDNPELIVREPIDMTQIATIRTMAQFASMLHSLGKHREASEVLEPFMLRLKNEPMFQKQLADWREVETVRSNYHMYRADEAREANEVETAKNEYWEAIETNSDNVDALIGMYKLKLQPEDAAKRTAKLNEIVNAMRADIRKTEEQLKASSSQDHAFIVLFLAEKCNSMAWVVANTEGSKEEALFLSRKACSLQPETAEWLDTLAHCYAALDKYEDAVQQQRLAVELKPHHPDLKRALARFEKALLDSKQK